MFTLSSPPVQSGLIPLLTALILVGLIRLIGGPGCGAALAGLALALAVLASYWATFRVPAFPPVGATNKLFYIVLFATIAGFTADLIAREGWMGRTVASLAGPFAALWIGLEKGLDAPWPAGVAVLIVVAVTAATGWRYHSQANRSSEIGATTLVLCLAMAACAFMSNAASSAQLAGGLAAATGGFVLWNWPKARFPFNTAALAAALSLTGGLAVQLALFVPKLETYALLPLVVIPFLVPLGARLVKGTGLISQGVRPVVVGLLCALPAAAAVLIVFFTMPEATSASGY
jgi:hypothetical protein